ncbi:MAG: hypothetical protein M1827_007226 [Pycnora praestabilis]|nr:MAG: hypothetical protein M1827_007226 [Pycnora praestabilis]
MSTRKSRAPSRGGGSSSSDGPRIPSVPQRRRHSDDEYDHKDPRRRRRRSRYDTGRGYDMGREKSSKVDLLLCVFHGAPSHSWRTAPFSFDRRKTDDKEIWEDLRRIYRDDLQKPWRRLFLFKKLKHIVPIEYTPNGVPIAKDAKDTPNAHSFMHAFHHPDRIRPEHEWVDFFTQFRAASPNKTVGLEFQEGLWAEKLAIIAILLTIAIIVVSIVWVLKGGNLQTVFTVMSFVLTGVAGKTSSESPNDLLFHDTKLRRSPSCIGGTVLPSDPFELIKWKNNILISHMVYPTQEAAHGRRCLAGPMSKMEDMDRVEAFVHLSITAN